MKYNTLQNRLYNVEKALDMSGSKADHSKAIGYIYNNVLYITKERPDK